MILFAMAILPVLVAAGAGWMIWRTSHSRFAIAGIVVLMAAQWAAAAIFGQRLLEGRPPILMLVLIVIFAATVATAMSKVGRSLADLPFAYLIGFQCFRLPLELVMHQAAVTGLMPEQMSFSGYNFDILTGLTALPVAWLAAQGKAPRGSLIAWNAIGSLLLVIIVAIAVASLPTFAAFGPDRLNTWIAHPPYIWLPGVLVQAALLGHIVIWRKLGTTRR